MKKAFMGLWVVCILGCDPVSDLEANIENMTPQSLTVEFISSDESLSKTLQIPPDGIELFQEGYDIGNTFLEPSLTEFDSVLIKNQSEKILKVYKANNKGKNIYSIDDWIASEPTKRFFKYEFEITSEDIE